MIEGQIPCHDDARAICFDAVAFHRLDKKSFLGDIWDFGGQVGQKFADMDHTVVNSILGVQDGADRTLKLIAPWYLYKVRWPRRCQSRQILGDVWRREMKFVVAPSDDCVVEPALALVRMK